MNRPPLTIFWGDSATPKKRQVKDKMLNTISLGGFTVPLTVQTGLQTSLLGWRNFWTWVVLREVENPCLLRSSNIRVDMCSWVERCSDTKDKCSDMEGSLV